MSTEIGRIIIYILKDMETHKIILTNPISRPLIDFILGKYELIRNCKNTCISTQEEYHNHTIGIAVDHPSEAVETSESLQSSGWKTPFIDSSHLFLDADHTLTYSKFSQSLVAFNFRTHTSRKIISLFSLFTDDIRAKLSHDKKVLLLIRESSLTILTLSSCLEKYSSAELLQKIYLPNSSCTIL